MNDPERVTLSLVPAAGDWTAPPECRLRAALKALLRTYGWRCVEVSGAHADDPRRRHCADGAGGAPDK